MTIVSELVHLFLGQPVSQSLVSSRRPTTSRAPSPRSSPHTLCSSQPCLFPDPSCYWGEGQLSSVAVNTIMMTVKIKVSRSDGPHGAAESPRPFRRPFSVFPCVWPVSPPGHGSGHHQRPRKSVPPMARSLFEHEPQATPTPERGRASAWFCRVRAHGPFPGGGEDADPADGRSYSSANAMRGENPDEGVRAHPQECVAGAQSHRPAPEKLEKPDPRACGRRWTACVPSRKTALERSLVRPTQPPTLRKSGHSVARPRLSRTRGAMEKSFNGTNGGGWEAAEHGGQCTDSESDPHVQIPLFLLICERAGRGLTSCTQPPPIPPPCKKPTG